MIIIYQANYFCRDPSCNCICRNVFSNNTVSSYDRIVTNLDSR